MAVNVLFSGLFFLPFAGKGTPVEDHNDLHTLTLNFSNPPKAVVDVSVSIRPAQDKLFPAGALDDFMQPE